ncbi:MAG: OmpA family protein [Cyclobacteriaceae bacterium]|nr:OmpA family protein [Cyclobacteriaceae bacterium]
MRILLSILLVFSFVYTHAQGIKKADKKYKRGEYEVAIERYQKKLNSPKHAAKANFKIAEAYRLSNRIKQAIPYYEEAIKKKYKDPNAYYYLAIGYKELAKYDETEKELESFLKVSKDDEMTDMAQRELSNLAELKIIMAKKNYYRVKNLDIINTSNAEYSPVYSNGELYFTSNRLSNKVYKATGTGFTDIYQAETRGARVDTTTLKKMPDLINDYNTNEGSVTFSPDGKTMVFAKGNTGKRKGAADVSLYITRFRNNSWSEPRILSISRPDSWDSSPAFSRDGRTLYFASNRPDPKAQGGIDLYSARMNSRGRFSKPQNLGTPINTPGDEMFPYVADDGKLYFSSTGHPGFGGLDIFVASRKAGEVEVENLGQPVNTSSDDFGMFLFSADRGFFTSNRPEGKGDDDIYTFVNEDPNLRTVNYFLHGLTLTHDEKDSTEILSNVRVSLVDFENNVLDEVVTDEGGNFNFRVYENENYVLMAGKEGADAQKYYVTRLDYSTVGRSIPQEELKQLVTNVTFDTLIYLEPIIIDKAIVLENIYYDFAKWDIRPDAAQELDKLVDILKDNPEISIELSSHTDSVDTESYNMRLSQRRAESAVDYIVKSGIDRSRITAKGYGESRPIARNTNPDGTDNPEGRQKNRRTEFKVTQIDATKRQKPEEEVEEKYFDEDKYFKDDDSSNNTP